MKISLLGAALLGVAAAFAGQPAEISTASTDVASVAARPVESATGCYRNPVIADNAPDPTVIRATDGLFYLYATGHATVVYRSADFLAWERVGQAFADSDRPGFVAGAAMWAPDINRIGDRYVLYYAMSTWGGEWSCGIGAAVSDRPDGGFHAASGDGKLFISSEIGVQNSIDPCFVEENNRKYLFWGSFRGIYATQLTDDGLAVKDMRDTIRVAGTAFEATCIHRHGAYYYLFASRGTCCEGDRSTYEVVVGRSEKLLGPYVDKQGLPMMENHASLVLTGNDRFAGPGHNARILTDDAGDDWMLYHAFERGTGGGRKVLLDRVVWSTDGWPTVASGTPSSSSEAPLF